MTKCEHPRTTIFLKDFSELHSDQWSNEGPVRKPADDAAAGIGGAADCHAAESGSWECRGGILVLGAGLEPARP